MKLERRVMNLELRVDDGEAPKIVGHAAVFNRVADIGWFRERIAPGAFADAVGADDVRALINHDPNLLLGRTPNTLRMTEDNVGLAVEIDPPDTQYARDLLTVMRRGDLTQMSFGFETVADEWDRSDPDSPLRTLKKVRLFDVSPVTFPAYPDTDVAVRSFEAFTKSQPKAMTRKIRASQAMKDERLVMQVAFVGPKAVS